MICPLPKPSEYPSIGRHMGCPVWASAGLFNVILFVPYSRLHANGRAVGIQKGICVQKLDCKSHRPGSKAGHGSQSFRGLAMCPSHELVLHWGACGLFPKARKAFLANILRFRYAETMKPKALRAKSLNT